MNLKKIALRTFPAPSWDVPSLHVTYL